MDQETPGIANKKLLIVSLILAAVVVVFYNVQISRVRSAARGKTVRLLRVGRDMQPGEGIDLKDLEVVEVETHVAEGLGNVITASQEDMNYVKTSKINQYVRKGSWLMFEHTVNVEKDNPSTRIRKGWVTHTFAIDPRQSPGEILRIGDRVNVLGMLSLKGKGLRTYRIIENLKVLEIGGRSYHQPSWRTSRRQSSDEGVRQYQKITVEAPPDVSRQLADVLTHVRGSLWVEVRNPTDAPAGRKAPEINPELRNIGAAPPGGDSRYRPPGR